MRPFRRRRPQAEPDLVDDGTLVVVARVVDPALSDGAAVADVPPGTRLLVRHLFAGLTPATHAALAAALTPDGWTTGPLDDGGAAAWSTRALPALAAAQGRARMAGLASRLGVDHVGWEALAPQGAPSAPR